MSEVWQRTIPWYVKEWDLEKIARELNEKGVPTTRGGKWYAGTIKYILENPLYKGVAHYKDNKVKNIDLVLF